MALSLEVARSTLAEEIDLVRRVVRGLTDRDLILASGCRGWAVADLVVHLRLGAEGLLTGVVCSSNATPDRDFVTYWNDWPPGQPAGFAEVRFTWASTAVYASGAGLRQHFDDVAAAAAIAAGQAPDGLVSFQGHTLRTVDFLGTWIVEFALHHLDFLKELPERPGPTAEALDVAALTVDGLVGGPRPDWWDATTYVLKGSGRQPLSHDDASRLGTAAERYPAFG